MRFRHAPVACIVFDFGLTREVALKKLVRFAVRKCGGMETVFWSHES